MGPGRVRGRRVTRGARVPALAVCVLGVLPLLAACSRADAATAPASRASTEETPEFAIAVLRPVGDSGVHGTVRFEEEKGQLHVVSDVYGLPPGPHAYHVHVYGDCTGPGGKRAGTHFNFVGSSLHPPKDVDRITGNLGELVAGPDGHAHADAPVPLARLDGPKSILGRAVIVHAKANDPSQPPIGAAGARIACGVIGVASP